MEWELIGGFCSHVGSVLVCCDEERAESKGEVLSFTG